jgi:uncharacterized protein
MSAPENNYRIDYIEFAATDIEKTKQFYSTVFGWKFEDYGPAYTSFHDGRLTGGFYAAESVQRSAPVVVIYSTDLADTKDKVTAAGGKIVKDTFAFPGGRRFHFADPSGNQLAVWSDPE